MHYKIIKWYIKKGYKILVWLYTYRYVCETEMTCSVMLDSLGSCGLKPTRLLCPWDSPGKNVGVSCHAHLQGFFPTQGWNPGSPALQADTFTSESLGKPRYIFFWCSVSKLCLTLCDPMDFSMPSLPVPHHLPEFAQFMSIESGMHICTEGLKNT